MKTYNPFIAAFLVGAVSSASLGNGGFGLWVLFALVALTVLAALVSYCLHAHEDREDTAVGETETDVDFTPLWDAAATWKRE